MSFGSGLAFVSVALAVGFTSYFIGDPFPALAAIVVGIVGFKQVSEVVKAIEIQKRQ